MSFFTHASNVTGGNDMNIVSLAANDLTSYQNRLRFIRTWGGKKEFLTNLAVVLSV